MDLLTTEQWKEFIKEHPQAHILQTASWGILKADYGWSPKFIRQGTLGAMVLFRRLPMGLSVGYIPRGPIGAGDWKAFWVSVDGLCKQENAVFLRVEPDVWAPQDQEDIDQLLPGFITTDHTIQPPQTILIDIQNSEEDILMAMKSKTRYNIRLAARKDVVVQQIEDVKTFHEMMLTTGDRDEFGIHSLDYYQRAYDLFKAEEACALLFASYQNQPLAGLMVFARGETAWYFYGASTNHERSRMPTYLLQWEAIRWAKSRRCKTYDLWGIPDYPEKALEDEFSDRSDGLWGVYRFKRGFGGEISRTIGTWDRIYRPGLYKLYQVWTARQKSSVGA